MLKTKEELVSTIKDNIIAISSDKNANLEIKEQLSNNGISGGRIENVFSDPDLLFEADIREVALLTEQFFLKTGIMELKPEDWFTEVEMKRARQFDRRLLTEDLAPTKIMFENTTIVGNGVYVTTIDVPTIAELMNTQILNYNYDIQRSAKIVKRNEQVIKKPTVYMKNVREIKEYLLKGQLVSTTLAFNAAVGSSETGEELTFDASTGTLIVNEGTQLDILDGYHRCLASQAAYGDNPDLDFRFMLMISNYTTREAQQYQAQLAKATPIPKTRVQELEANRRADTVVRQLRAESELKDRISSHHQVSKAQGELVSYNVLSDAIDREFKMRTSRDVREVSSFLKEFFDYLIGDFAEEFVYNSEKKESLMSYNKMFAGYIALAAKLKKEKVSLDKLKDILKQIDFSRDNPLWKDLGIINIEGRVSVKADEKKIAKYFKELKVN